MDPSTDPPAAPPAPAHEPPPAHTAHVANPTPHQAAVNSHSHPPYTEMITAAVTALKEKNGSSRQAIAKYIERAYTNLPASHSALLTHHLKRLKNNGHLVMVKHSYMLPRSVPLSSSIADSNPNLNLYPNPNPNSEPPKRGPGRPPKPKPDAQPIGPETMLISLGLSDGPVQPKRGPGRPPKGSLNLGGPVKRGRGRPPRPKSLAVLAGQNVQKRGPGRPRGRPRKMAPSSLIRAATPGRPRGRPPKNPVAAPLGGGGGGGEGGALVAAGNGGGGGGGVAILPLKRRGRPPGAKPQKLSGKPLGRPRKKSSGTDGIFQAVAAQQLLAYEDLKNKVQHFQDRIKQAVSVVKPHLNSETAVIALGALQELEELATMDLSVPVNVQPQVPVQVPIHVQEPIHHN